MSPSSKISKIEAVYSGHKNQIKSNISRTIRYTKMVAVEPLRIWIAVKISSETKPIPL